MPTAREHKDYLVGRGAAQQEQIKQTKTFIKH